jgi:hypothetical protein
VDPVCVGGGGAAPTHGSPALLQRRSSRCSAATGGCIDSPLLHGPTPASAAPPTSSANRRRPAGDAGTAKLWRPVARAPLLLVGARARAPRRRLDGELLCSGATRQTASPRAGARSWERGPAQMASLLHPIRYVVDRASRENEGATA